MRKRMLLRSADSPHRVSSCDSLERRPLRLVPLAPPDYTVAPSLLLNSCIEKEVVYAGTIGGVPLDVETTNRATMLAWVDRGYASSQLSCHTEREAILSISCYNLKLSARAPPEELIVRLPIGAVESAVYLRDDHSHLVLLHHAPDPAEPAEASRDAPSALTVLACDGRIGAEEVCALVRQSFQLLYTEATMQFFDRQVTAAGDLPGAASPTRSAEEASSTASWPNAPEPGAATLDRLQDYMQELHSVLPAAGMSQFANHLRQWKAGQTPFRRFLQHLLRLFADVDATHLVAGLRPFVPPADVPVFEDFLREQGLGGKGAGAPLVNGRPAGAAFVRAFSQASTLSGASLRSAGGVSAHEVERRLDAALEEVRGLEAIVQGHVPLETVAKKLAGGEAPHFLAGAFEDRGGR